MLIDSKTSDTQDTAGRAQLKQTEKKRAVLTALKIQLIGLLVNAGEVPRFDNALFDFGRFARAV